MGKRKSDRPFCDGCPNLDEGMSFLAEDVIQELKWALECAQTGISPLSHKKQTVEDYIKDRAEEISADEEEARNCDVCEEKTKEEERGKEEVQFT